MHVSAPASRSIRDLPADMLPRERLLDHGPDALSDAELLAVLLRTGVAGCNAIDLGRALLARFGGLRGLFTAPAHELLTVAGVGPTKASQLLAALELSRRQLAEAITRTDALTQPDLVKRYCAATLAHRDIECCIALYLDTRNRLIGSEELARGTIDQAAVYPREVVRAALRHHASSVILAHNHPSGVAEPSRADENFTRCVRDALALVDIRLLDHIIVAGQTTVSLAERGQL
jgi:DNA repair protein RadC